MSLARGVILSNVVSKLKVDKLEKELARLISLEVTKTGENVD